MKQKDTLAWKKSPFFSKKWELSRDEKYLLGEKLEREYHQKVREYCIIKIAETLNCVIAAEFAAACASFAATCVVCNFLQNQGLSSTALLLTGISIFSTSMIAAAVVVVLITKDLKIKGLQNPKDWKAKILDQKISEKKGYSKNANDPLANKTSAINKAYTIDV